MPAELKPIQVPFDTVLCPSHRIYSWEASELEYLLSVIRKDRLTGSVTINFNQGTPAGTLEWKERVKNK